MRIVTDTPRHEIVYRMPWDEYRNTWALNPSSIVCCDKSPLHVRDAMTGGRKDTEAMAWGRMLHTAVLEHTELEKRYALPELNKGGEYVRTAKQKVAAAAQGIELVLPHQLDGLAAAAQNVADCRALQPYIPTRQAEVVVFSEECGCQVKGRIDWVSADPLAILDVKTARDVSERKFSRDFYQLHYDVKLGLYQRWLQREAGVQHIPVYVLLVENAKPFDVQLVPRVDGVPVPIPDAVLMRGASKGLRWIERIRECLDRDEWPGAAEMGDWSLQTPSWEMDDDEIEGAEVM